MTDNSKLFAELKSLGLPSDQYAVTASGPMGVRGLREINDVDILITNDLWEKLLPDHQETNEDGIRKMKLSDNVEAMFEGSFPNADPDNPSISSQIKEAELIDGIPFVNLETIKFFKRKSARDKDLNDLRLIDEWEERNKAA